MIKKVIQHGAFYHQKKVIQHKVRPVPHPDIYSGYLYQAGKQQKEYKVPPNAVLIPVQAKNTYYEAQKF